MMISANEARKRLSEISIELSQVHDDLGLPNISDARADQLQSKAINLLSDQNKYLSIVAKEQEGRNKYEQYFDSPGSSRISLPNSLEGSVIYDLAKRAAHTMEIPLGTVFLVLLSGAAASVATNYVTRYRTGTRVPAVLHVACEHPPSTGKSNLIGLATGSYVAAMISHNKKINALNKDENKQFSGKLPYGFILKTDATSASIDAELSDCDSGRVVIAASEQAAFQSLFPAPGGHSSNNSILLNGWMGEYISGGRTTRRAFSGYVQSSVTLLAQVGSIQRVLSESNQTGLAERFLFAVEPDMLGARTFSNGFLTQEDKEQFNRASSACVKKYSDRVKIDPGSECGFLVSTDLHDLECLYPSSEGYDVIRQKRIMLEPYLGELNRAGELTYVGWLGKLETHALKVALVLHVFNCLGAGTEPPPIIPTHLIESSLELVLMIGEHMRGVIQASGEAGDAAEVEAVLNLVSERAVTMAGAQRILRNRKPFHIRKDSSKSGFKAAGDRIRSMLSEGLLVLDSEGFLKAI